MKYIEVTFTMESTELFRDLLIDTLGNEGPYESFVETDDGLQAYVQQSQYDSQWLSATVEAFPVPLKYKAVEMADKNWNAEWEKEHEAVLVTTASGATIWVRAPFHPHRTDVDYEILVDPKQAFGSAHHPTTYMMLDYVAGLPMVRRKVLDMGCGTAVLAILAKMRGAAYVEGIDVDEWAFRNAQENVAANGTDITLKLGNAENIEGQFDVIVANINRNILLNDMDRYVAALNAGGTLLLSGFYEADEGVLMAKANELGMTLKSKKNRDGWSALEFVKTANCAN